jgi:hypothetical protein
MSGHRLGRAFGAEYEEGNLLPGADCGQQSPNRQLQLGFYFGFRPKARTIGLGDVLEEPSLTIVNAGNYGRE